MTCRAGHVWPLAWRVCTLIALSMGLATPSKADESPDAVHRVGSLVLSQAAWKLLREAARAHNPRSTDSAVMEAIAEDHLLGRYAFELVGDAQLFEDQRVGRPLAITAQARLVSLIERVHGHALRAAWQQATLASPGPQRQALTPEWLQAVLKPGEVRLDGTLSPSRARALGDVVLLDARIDDVTWLRITLKDVWEQLDVHGRSELYRLNTDFVHRQAVEVWRTAMTRHWALRDIGLSESDWQQLLLLMEDHERRLALQRVMGASPDIHAGTSSMARWRAEVTSGEIRRYQARHPELFERTERVLARHIRCPDEASAQQAHAELQAGASFEAVAQRYSIAATRALGGALGWIERSAHQAQWLHLLALAQPPGAPSRPIREPAGVSDAGAEPAWQIVQVTRKEVTRHAADSEAARFIAVGAIAKQRASERFASLRAHLLRAGNVARVDKSDLPVGPEVRD